MKKTLFFAICLLVAGSVSAQSYYYGPRHVKRAPQRRQVGDFYKVRAGITGGVNIANTVNAYNDNYSTGTIAAFNAGVTLDVPLIYPLSFEPEVLFSQKGYSAQTTDGNFTQRSNYIDVPLLAKLKLGPNFNFLIGPQLSFPISTTQTYDNGFSVVARQYYDTRSYNTVLDGVVGVSFDLSPNVELRARYTIDLQQNDQNSDYGPDYRNQVWQIGLGIKFE